ncbi:MAG: hypothetical protein LBR78_02080 [Holosporales bacterium]|jgi:hypothetical protein|nr:hypothetical protein [Holosporales bacterium]
MRKLGCILITLGTFIALNTETLGAGFSATRARYNELIEHLRRERDPQRQQRLLSEILQYARVLLGIVDGISFAPIDLIKPLWERMQAEAKKIEEAGGGQSDPKAALKIKRDVNRLSESSKFLMGCATLLDALYKDRELLPFMVSKVPEDVPYVAMEITTMLHIMDVAIKDPADIEQPLNKMVELSASGEDGTYLLSRIMTCCISQPVGGIVDVKALLSSPNFPSEGERRYLPIR